MPTRWGGKKEAWDGGRGLMKGRRRARRITRRRARQEARTAEFIQWAASVGLVIEG